MKFLWRTDVHFSDQTPRGRGDDWKSAVADKLSHVGELAREHQVRAVLDGGDFFNDKVPHKNSHRLVREVAEIHRQYPCEVLANIGNHDVRYGSLEYLEESPLAVCFATGIFHRCDGENQKVFVCPEDGTTVRVRAIPYGGTRIDPEAIRVQKGSEDHLVILIHQLGTPEVSGGFFPGEDVLTYQDVDHIFPEASVVCFGHWHKDQGVGRTPGGVWVVNIGSLTRATLAEDDRTRIPKVALLDLVRGQIPRIETLQVRHRPEAEVFRDREEVASRPLLDTENLVRVAIQVGSGGESVSVEDRIRTLCGVSDRAKEILLDVALRVRSG